MDDPIIEEIHRTGEAIARCFGNDLHAICDDARRRQAADGRKVVDLAASTEHPLPQPPPAPSKKVG